MLPVCSRGSNAFSSEATQRAASRNVDGGWAAGTELSACVFKIGADVEGTQRATDSLPVGFLLLEGAMRVQHASTAVVKPGKVSIRPAAGIRAPCPRHL